MPDADIKPAGMQRIIITITVVLTTVLQTLDTTIANVALPQMQASVSATPEQISWVLTSYLIASAIFIAPTAYFVSRIGRRRMFLIATAGFTLTSALCGLATSLVELMIFRFLQGALGASLVPLSQVVLLDIYPAKQHGSAMAWWALGAMIGPIIGPTVGGILTDQCSWRWIFYINVPFGVLAFAGIWAALRKTNSTAPQPLNVVGFAMLSVALAALQLALDRGQSRDWLNSTEIIVEFLIAAIAGYFFLINTFISNKPFIEPRLFRDANYAFGVSLSFLTSGLMFCTMALLPIMLESVYGYTALTIGFVLAPRGLGTMLAMLIAGRTAGRLGIRRMMIFGALITAYSMWDMSRATLANGYGLFLTAGFIQGIGLGLLFLPNNILSYLTLAPDLRDQGTSVYSLLRNVGGSIAIAATMTLLAQKTQTNHALLASHIDPVRDVLHQPWTPPQWNVTTPEGANMLDMEVTRQARFMAFLFEFRLLQWLSLATAAVLLLVPAARAREKGATPAAAE